MTLTTTNLAGELAEQTIGCRLGFRWLGGSKRVDDDQQDQAAAAFGANAECVSMSKKLFNAKHPAYRKVSSVRNKARRHWLMRTLPFTEPGVRLLRRDAVEDFRTEMESLGGELHAAVAELDAAYSELIDEARERLGSLFNPTDYPSTLSASFAMTYDFRDLSPPDYLAQLSPELFQREQARMKAQFDKAVELAEQAFVNELSAMIDRIIATLSGDTDGKPKVFRDTMVDNLKEFFERFNTLSICSSDELKDVVAQAQGALAGVTPKGLRTSGELRVSLSDKMSNVATKIASSMMVDKPTRKIRLPNQNAA